MAAVTYHHVLLSTDGSDHATRAGDHAIAIAKAFQAQFSVLAVVDIYAFMNSQTPNYSVDLLEDERAFLQKAVDEIAQVANAAGIASVSPKVVEGSPHTMIADTIRESGVDLVVVGSHGRNVIERLILGSTSEYLVHHSPCPVMIVRPEE
ncbi:MAG TPA: universal stress protein [Chloroflexota bacterium]|nr:universal stress protein [Chloroflexota bacterium]